MFFSKCTQFIVVFCFFFCGFLYAQDTTVEDVSVAKPAEVKTATESKDADEPKVEAGSEERDLTNELVVAVILRKRDKIKDLLAEGADVNAADKRGLTPYFAAKITGDTKLAKMLEVLGAKTDGEFDPKEFVDRALKLEDKPGRPGVVVLIANGEEVLYSGAVGLASIEHDVPITTKTKFRIGSVSKQFTATAILKLQEDGKLSVQDPLSKFVPDFPRGDEVTLHHLLTHTSGLKNYTSDAEFYETVTSGVDVSEMIDAFKAAGFDEDPGARFSYCNTGYYLLSHIVEVVSEQKFGDYLRTTFFEPLEMHDTGVHEATGIYANEATGYSVDEDAVNKALDWDMSRARGAGDIYSTVHDLHRWNLAIFGGKVLNEESLKQAHQLQVQVDADGEQATASTLEMPYGYGWMIDEHRGLKRVWHSGGLNGFVSQLSYYPEQEYTFVALHNAMPGIAAFTPGVICQKAAEAFLWKKMKSAPKFEVAKDIDPETYDDYVGKYDYGGAIMKVTRDGDKLMAQLAGQPNIELFPYGKDKFFWKVVDAQAEFQRNDEGKVTGVRHSQGIAKFLAARIVERTPVELKEEQLDRFVGQWKYGLGRLTIRLDESQLYGKMTGQAEFKLFPESENKVFWKAVNAQLEVEFDQDGRVKKATHYQGGQVIDVQKIEK